MVKGSKRVKTVEDKLDTTLASLPDLVGQSFGSCSRMSPQGYPVGQSIESRFNNLCDLESPYSTINESYISPQKMVNLCRRAYENVGAFRTSIDIMTDLANTPIKLEGGNAQSLDFFKAWLSRINDFHLKEQSFSELFTSGTVLLLRVDAELTVAETLKLNQNYANEESKAVKEVSIPTKYILLDSANICLQGLAYDYPTYYKILNAFELDQLKRSQDDNNKEAYKSIKKAIDAYVGGNLGQTPLIELDKDKLHTIFYQKKDYQPFPIPMGYSVLDDVNLLRELKKADAILARTVEYIILLITMGAERDKGGTDPKALNAMKSLFQNEKIGRVLVSDYTTKAEFVIPDLEKIMNPIKYQEVDKNIASGMMNIFFGEQKYADSMTKLKALTRKIEQTQELFLRDFLNPEIKRISKQMNFKSFPIARMEPVRIDDQTNTQRIYAQLVQLGVLSAEDAVDLFETGLFPTYEEVQKRQENFRAQKDKGYFQPITGGPFDNLQLGKQSGDQSFKAQKYAIDNAPAPVAGKPGGGGKTPKKNKAPAPAGGRPPNTNTPQTTKRVSQTGGAVFVEDLLYSQKKVAENTLKLIDAKKTVEEEYKKAHDVKRLTKNHKDRVEIIQELLFENENPDDWNSLANSYVNDLSSHPPKIEVQQEIQEIGENFEIGHESATLLYHSTVN